MTKKQRMNKIYYARWMEKHGSSNGRIYMINNILTGDMYIGCTKAPLVKRMTQVLAKASSGVRGKLYENIREHGKEYFDITELYECSYEESMKEVEKEYIEEHSPSLNNNKCSNGRDIWSYVKY